MRYLLVSGALFVAIVLAWVAWGDWPAPDSRDLAWKPEVIVVLGGGNEARVRQALHLAQRFPDIPLVVTGDGGQIISSLRESGLTSDRLFHEGRATSTLENAAFTKSILDELQPNRGVLVTNWFHATRALAVFREVQPELEWEASFEDAPETLDRWERGCQRRERLAALHYLIVHGIYSF